jgi:hypothetical protein
VRVFVRRFRKIANTYLLALSCLCVCPSGWNNSAVTGRMFIKFGILLFLKICRENSSFIKNPTRRTGTIHEDQCTFLVMPRSVLLRIRDISDKGCRGNQNRHFMLNNFLPKFVPFMRQRGNISYSEAGNRWWIRSMRSACWKTKVACRHSEYVIFIAFLQLRWLGEYASMLRLNVQCVSSFKMLRPFSVQN